MDIIPTGEEVEALLDSKSVWIEVKSFFRTSIAKTDPRNFLPKIIRCIGFWNGKLPISLIYVKKQKS